MRFLKQSTSVDVPIGPFVDDSDFVTPATTLTITQPDIRLKKNNAAWAQKNASQTLSHEENGFYEVTLDATDTNTLGLLRLHVLEAGALIVWEDFMVLPANVYDALIGGSDKLQVDVDEIDGSADAATRLERGASGAVTFTVGGGSSTTSVVTSAISPAAGVGDQFKGRTIVFDENTTTANLRGYGGSRVSASGTGGSAALTVTPPLPATPVSTDFGTLQ